MDYLLMSIGCVGLFVVSYYLRKCYLCLDVIVRTSNVFKLLETLISQFERTKSDLETIKKEIDEFK